MRKIFMTAAICLALSVSAMPETAETQVSASPSTEQTIGEQTIVESDAVPSTEVDYVEESPVAKKMTQAEKAHNAAVNDSWGGAITIIAMCIVISALAVLSLLFLGFGKISEALIANKKKAVAKPVNIDGTPHEHDDNVDSGETIAAIAMALSEHFKGGHDMEETILTIRRLKRTYSPWNSKIYNLRQLPELHQNRPSRSAF